MYNASTHKLVWNIADVKRNWKETNKKQGMLTKTIMCSHKEYLLLLILLAPGTDDIVFYLNLKSPICRSKMRGEHNFHSLLYNIFETDMCCKNVYTVSEFVMSWMIMFSAIFRELLLPSSSLKYLSKRRWKNIMIQDKINSQTVWIQLNRQTQTYLKRFMLKLRKLLVKSSKKGASSIKVSFLHNLKSFKEYVDWKYQSKRNHNMQAFFNSSHETVKIENKSTC